MDWRLLVNEVTPSSPEVTVEYILLKEGGYSDSPHDPGGQTIFGIARKFNPKAWEQFDKLLAAGDMDGARDLARRVWLGYGPDGNLYMREWDLERFPQSVSNKLTDILGPRNRITEAIEILQKALWSASGMKLKVDGVYGPRTRALLEAQVATQAGERELLAALREAIAGVYERLVAQNPEKEPNLSGWTNRSRS